ncbi:MAG: mannitol-/sugar-/sorbitol-6-phosphatase [Thermoleophilales bacterium]|nr:mannitol-/sugar-/sorbitol-6-phosphatase [Thermoleophilales bacterium]
MNRAGGARFLFDLDGTLIDSLASVDRHWRRWALRNGLDAERVLMVAHGHRSVDSIRLLVPETDPVREAARIDAEQAADASGTRAMPHAAELLASLGPGDWAIVTSATRAIATARLRAAALPAPAIMVCGDEVENGKPAPDGYLEAARRLGAAPASCVVVEDTPNGIAAGSQAGMTTVALPTTHPAEALAAADHLIPGLAELRQVVCSA